MNSFIILSLIKVAQAVPPKSKISHRKLFYPILNFLSSNILFEFFQANCEEEQSHKRCLVVSSAPHRSHSADSIILNLSILDFVKKSLLINL